MDTTLTITDECADLFERLALAQAELDNAVKDSKNPHFKSNYANLATVMDTIRPVFSKHGLAFSQPPGRYNNETECVEVPFVLAYKNQRMQGVSSAPISKVDAQGYGSCVTYVRRYQALGVAGIAPEDDDGNAASGKGGKKPGAKKGKPADPGKVAAYEGLIKSAVTVVELKSILAELKKEIPDIQEKLGAVYKSRKSELEAANG